MVLTDIVRHHVAFMIAIFTYQSITGSGKIELSQWSLTFFISLLLIYGVGFIDDRIRNVIAGRNDSSPKICMIQNKTISLSTNNLFHLAYEVPDWHTEFW